MTRRKVQAKDTFHIFTPSENEVIATNTHVYVSSDKHRIRTQQVDVITRSSPPPDEVHDAVVDHPSYNDEELLNQPQSEEFATTFFHQVAGVQVVAKRKRKRYESSVSTRWNVVLILV